MTNNNWHWEDSNNRVNQIYTDGTNWIELDGISDYDRLNFILHTADGERYMLRAMRDYEQAAERAARIISK